MMVCKACGHIDWESGIRTEQIYNYIKEHGTVTASEVAGAVGIALASASNNLQKLVRHKLVKRSGPRVNPAGGVIRYYTLVTEEAES